MSRTGAGDESADVSELDLVQLGQGPEIDPGTLHGSGTDLVTALDGRKFDPESSGERRYLCGLLPPSGWRVIDAQPPGEQGLAGVALAAPHPERPGGWALVYLSGRDDRWHFSADPGPEYPRPGRAARRRHLRLDWPVTPVLTEAGKPPALSLRLTNTADTRWSNGPDLVRVLAWILDPGTGDPLPAERWFASSGSDHRPVELAPANPCSCRRSSQLTSPSACCRAATA